MPPSSRYSRTNASPSRSTTHSGQTIGQTRINIVKRLAIEGKAERGPDGKADGASIRMYLRISLPVDAVVPGSAIPLFPEDNLKILDSHVHPLDNNAVPYNFSSTTCPLLHKAARALNLPGRSRESYLSLFGSTASSSSSPTSSSSSIPPLDGRFTGHVLVSQYQVSYVLPKEFPPRTGDSSGYGRRSSANEYQFMAAIDIWAPFMTKPPSYPYLLSLPVPRCLSNHIRLKIFPPGNSLASSAASLSSGEGDSWDLTSEPHVTRNASRRRSRTPSYQQFADDESSDSSGTGFADGYGIQGTFPSTDYMRVRWATPLKTSDLPETSDGRRRVGIKEAKGETTCVVLGKAYVKGKTRGRSGFASEEGVIMKLEYSGTCKGVWFPGVATMLAMDVSLDAGDCDVAWAPDEEHKWTVSGGPGFTGFAAGPPPKVPLAKSNAPAINVVQSTPEKHEANRTNGYSFQSNNSKASLLRAPLPSHNMEDLSFESSPNTTPLSSVASLATIPSSPERRGRRSSVSARAAEQEESRPPKVPLSIHLNMNELVPAKKNIFTFTVSGTVLVIPRSKPFLLNSRSSPTHSDSDEGRELDPVVMPQFRILYADKETCSTIISNEMDDASLDIFNSKGRINDAQSRKTVLQPGGQTKCGNDGARLGIRAVTSLSAYSHRSRRDESVESGRRTPGSRPRTPSGGLTRSMSATALRQTFLLGTPKPKRDGALMIPNVAVHVLPLLAPGSTLPTEYSVRMTLPAPSDADTEWLEFGLAQSSPPSYEAAAASLPPAVQIASASVEGVPVRFETSATVKPEGKLPALGLTFEETSTKEWITWVKVHIGEAGGGNVQVVYLVKADAEPVDEKKTRRKKDKAAGSATLDVLLPSFALPVGSLEVTVEKQPDLIIQSPQSNLAHRQISTNGFRLLHYSLPEFFYPSLLLIASSSATPSPSSNVSSSLWRPLIFLVLLTSTAIALFSLADRHATGVDLLQARQSLESCSISLSNNTSATPDPITVTTTIYSTVTSHVYHTLDASTSSRQSIATPPTTPDAPAVDRPTTLTTTTAITTLTPTRVTSTTPPSATPASDNFSVRDLLRMLPSQIDGPVEIPRSLRTASRVFMQGVGLAWKIWQKIYHFPA